MAEEKINKNPWVSVELADAVGMATNPVSPSMKTARLIQNLQSHVKSGMLKTRPGYTLKYALPSDSSIYYDPADTTKGFLNFHTFTDKQADPAGKEITCLIQKGTIQPITGSGVADTQNMLCVWVSHSWSGTAWVEGWQWLNKTIITKITTGSDSTYTNMIKVYGTAGLSDDALVGWTIHNKTKGEYAKIITSKIDGSNTRICHTFNDSTWDVDDVIIIIKNFVNLTQMAELYNVTWDEIQFHTILNDLRIGFGGQANRPGIMIGYRKKYLMLEKLDFTSYTDIDSSAIEDFAKIDGIILDTTTITQDVGGLRITEEAGGSLDEDTYYFRMIGVMDDFQEQWIAEGEITTSAANKDIKLIPYFNFYKLNPRITKIRIYKSLDKVIFYNIKELILRADIFSAISWYVSGDGTLVFESTELHNDTNAIATSNTNSKGIWSEFPEVYSWQTFSVALEITNYVFKFGTGALIKPSADARTGIKIAISGLKGSTTYELVAKFKSSAATSTVYAFFVGESLSTTGRPITEIAITNSWVEYTVDIETGDLEEEPKYLVIQLGPISATYNYVNDLSLTEKGVETYSSTTTVSSTEMKSELGYNPTYNIVKGWDQALVYRGRTFYLNPYVEKRYENYILKSHIHSNGSYMYDIASFGEYGEIEKFDSNECVGMIILPTGSLLILKDRSALIVDTETLSPTEPVYWISCKSKNTIVDINGVIRWCGDEDIYVYAIGGSGIKGILNETIRDLYLAITDKTKLQAVRDKFNTYRIRIYDTTNKTEYLLTENGWVKEVKNLFPQVYRQGENNRIYFLNAGNIYLVDEA